MADRPSIPQAVAESIEAGIPAAKAFRVYADTSILELADTAHLDVGRLCLIEAGLAPTRSEANAIGGALDVPTALISGNR